MVKAPPPPLCSFLFAFGQPPPPPLWANVLFECNCFFRSFIFAKKRDEKDGTSFEFLPPEMYRSETLV